MEAELCRILGEACLADAHAIQRSTDHARRTGEQISLDDAWPGIHAVMTGEMPIPKYEAIKRGIQWSEESLENVLLGGEPLPARTAFGPLRRLSPAEVARLAAGLDALSPEEFAALYDAEQLDADEIPPGGWDDERGVWLTTHYTRLRAFFLDAAQVGQAIVVAIE